MSNGHRNRNLWMGPGVRSSASEVIKTALINIRVLISVMSRILMYIFFHLTKIIGVLHFNCFLECSKVILLITLMLKKYGNIASNHTFKKSIGGLFDEHN